MAKKVYVAMSGGVDSSLSAALLVQQGFDVTGIYMKNWSRNLPGHYCSWKEDYQDAKRVASELGIDFKVYDFEKDYRELVVDYMISEYQAGRTPNPDVMCNQEIKFKLFFDTAIAEGADFIATGHYSVVKDGSLHAGSDANKDQSYFLYRVSRAALRKTFMPVGELEKTSVRKIAKKLGLATADKKDSQGICFVGKVGIKEFLLAELGPQPVGDVIDQNAKVIGQHDGALYYTLGQRRGLNIGGGLPYYVTGKNIDKNQVFVTTNLDDDNLWKNDLTISDVHWIDGEPNAGSSYSVRTRYRAALINATHIKKVGKNSWHLGLADAVRAVTPGQSAVIYSGSQVIGGGLVI